MMNDTHEILNSLLCDWHRWARGYQHVADIHTSPMFRETKAGRQWDTVDQIIDQDIEHSRMEMVDHLIMTMDAAHRTALQLQARNLYTGHTVWSSVRLPANPEQRAMVLFAARTRLTVELEKAGIL